MTCFGTLECITVMVLGRSSGGRSGLIEELLRKFADSGAQIERFERRYVPLARCLDDRFRRVVGKLFGPAGIDWVLARNVRRKMSKGTLVLFDPYLWPLFILHPRRQRVPVKELRHLVRERHRRGQRILFVSHSAGGILGAMLELEDGVIGHVCFGYPFKHPQRAEEPYRTRSLYEVRKPFLIFQGDGDAYGSIEDARRYRLSAQIALHAVAGDHDCNEVREGERFLMFKVVADLLQRVGYDFELGVDHSAPAPIPFGR